MFDSVSSAVTHFQGNLSLQGWLQWCPCWILHFSLRPTKNQSPDLRPQWPCKNALQRGLLPSLSSVLLGRYNSNKLHDPPSLHHLPYSSASHPYIPSKVSTPLGICLPVLEDTGFLSAFAYSKGVSYYDHISFSTFKKIWCCLRMSASFTYWSLFGPSFPLGYKLHLKKMQV